MRITGNNQIFKKLTQKLVRRFAWDRRGNIAPLVALLIVPLVGLLGVATEGGGWFLVQRAAQNAADSAVIAAATNGGNGGTDYAAEAQSVASSYGFTNGTNNATVTVPAPATYGSVTSCASSPCYRVTVTKAVPLYLLRIVGYSGDTTVNGHAGQTIGATALATTKPVDVPICLLGLQSSGKPAISTNGSPAANLGCNVMSNGNSNCNGHSITSGYSLSGGTNTGSKDCGTKSTDNVDTQDDPYAGLTSDIPNEVNSVSNNCTTNPNTYYPETDANWPSGTNTLTSSTLPAVSVFCGDVKLGGNLTVSTASPGSLIIIENGMLDLNGFTLQSAAGAGLTIIFSSPQGAAEAYTSGGTPTNFVCDNATCAPGGGTGGVLDISSPTSGTWSGIALYQDLNLPLQGPAQCTGNDQWSYSGSSPTWDISGVVDLSRTNFCVSGAINKSTNGYSCLTIVSNSTQVNGTGNLFYQNSQSQCAQQGVTQIEAQAYVLGQLVY